MSQHFVVPVQNWSTQGRRDHDSVPTVDNQLGATEVTFLLARPLVSRYFGLLSALQQVIGDGTVDLVLVPQSARLRIQLRLNGLRGALVVEWQAAERICCHVPFTRNVAELWSVFFDKEAPAAHSVGGESGEGQILVVRVDHQSMSEQDGSVHAERFDNGEKFFLAHGIQQLRGRHLLAEEGDRAAHGSIWIALHDDAPDGALRRVRVDLEGERKIRKSQHGGLGHRLLNVVKGFLVRRAVHLNGRLGDVRSESTDVYSEWCATVSRI